MYLGNVLIFAAVQSLFSLVPQAAGAGNSKMVSNYLIMGLLWSCVFLLIPTAIFFWIIGDVAPLPDAAAGYGYGYEGGGGCGGPGLEPEAEPAAQAVTEEPQVSHAHLILT